MAKKRVGILTGGGDVPGLNIAIKSVVLNSIDSDYEIVGIRRGWLGLLNYNIDDEETHELYIRDLNPMVVRRVDRTGGTFLHTSRANPSRVRAKDTPEFLVNSKWGKVVDELEEITDYTDHILNVIDHLKLDSLITIGGDDTLSYSNRLVKEGVKLNAIPKTMDNDVLGTEYCIGFSTAVTQAVNLITNFRTSVGSHERIGVVELFGRNSGETALITGYLSYVDRTIICEVPFNTQEVAELLASDKRNSKSHYSLCVISEGAHTDSGEIVEWGAPDAYGHRKLGGIGEVLSDQIKILTGNNTMYQKLGYLVRSGPADMLDRMVAMNYGALAMQLTMKNDFGHLVGILDGNYSIVPIETVISGKRQVDVDLYYDKENYRPKVKNILGLPMFLH
ncbi:MAG: 6-phosphofructokinase [Anaerolineaceae bacterium]|jgi:6-phosphofructokinase 1|nr:6-phosphofructokinase [Anaerolineaceae bacterium]HQJ31825.1 6-phosphofructokinase [Anaerolineaceae bacterium]